VAGRGRPHLHRESVGAPSASTERRFGEPPILWAQNAAAAIASHTLVLSMQSGSVKASSNKCRFAWESDTFRISAHANRVPVLQQTQLLATDSAAGAAGSVPVSSDRRALGPALLFAPAAELVTS
jgi:hypothetical protein